jgi:hypothetical protein
VTEIRQRFEIRTSKFPPMPGEDDELVNEGMYGKALALHLGRELATRGIETDEPFAEDWGWHLGVKDPRLSAFLGIGMVDDDEYVVFIEPSRDQIFRWFRFVDARPLRTRLAEALLDIFDEDADIELDE